MLNILLRIWPGLSGLLHHGRWSFLCIALGFAFACDTLLIVNGYWTELLTREWKYYSVGLFLLVWFLLYHCGKYFERKIEIVDSSDRKRNFFGDAITQYLQGNWFQTECFLNEILKRNPRDVEALLMLATLLRHTRRFEEARLALLSLQKLEGAGKWYFEILMEQRFLEEPAAGSYPETPEPSELSEPLELSESPESPELSGLSEIPESSEALDMHRDECSEQSRPVETRVGCST